MLRPRVLILSLAYYPFVGGAEVAIKELTDRLPQYNWEMITANLDGRQRNEETIGRVVVRRVGGGRSSKYFFPWLACCLAERDHRERPYQLVWAMMANQAGVAGAWFKKSHPTVPFLLTLQEGDDLDSLAYRFRLIFPRLAGVFRRPDRIQVISRYLERWAKRMSATCPIAVIPNGVDLDKFKSQNAKVKSESEDEKVVITTSRLVWKNGVDILIRSLTFLPDNVRLRVLGAGPEEEALKTLVEGLNLAPRVSFLGQVESSAVGQYLARADVFCRPSRSEGLGNAFLEAMAVGLPVVGTPVGGIPDFLQAGRTGWLCRPDDPQSVAEQVKFILDPTNRSAVQAISARAQQLVHENYDWGRLAIVLASILKRLL